MTRRDMTMAEWQRHCAETLRADTTGRPSNLVLGDLGGVSPGGAAAELRVSRQWIHTLMTRGQLHSLYIWDNALDTPRKRRGKAPSCIFVTENSLRRVKLTRPGEQQELMLGKALR